MMIMAIGFAQQPIIIFQNNIQLENDAVIQIDSLMRVNYYNEAISYVEVKNNTASEMNVRVRRTVIDSVPNSLNQICWAGLCFAPSVWDSQTMELLAPGQTSDHERFSGHYLPDIYLGMTVIRYTFYNDANHNDTASVIVKYNYSGYVSVNEILAKSVINNPYPNPAKSKISFDYQLPSLVKSASVKLYNIVGQEVKSENIIVFSGKHELQLNDLQEGVYFMTLYLNGEAAKTNRIIVKR